MKKVISLLLVAMVCVSLYACGGNESTGEDKNSETKQEEGITPNQPTEKDEDETETIVSDYCR